MPQTIPIACSLDQAELGDRAQQMEGLGRSLVAVDAEATTATLRFAGGKVRLEEFVQAESACCPFFEFELTEKAETTTLRIGAPEGGDGAVRALVAGFVAGWGEPLSALRAP